MASRDEIFTNKLFLNAVREVMGKDFELDDDWDDEV